MISEDKRISEKIIWCLTVILLSSFNILDESKWISLILFGITVSIFILSAFQSYGKVKLSIGPFHIFTIVFALYCICTSIWAINSDAAIQKGITIIEILICMSLIAMHYNKFTSVKQLTDIIMYAGFIISMYAFLFYGMSTVHNVMVSGERLDNSFANINSIAMAGSISIIIAAYNLLFIDKKKLFLLILIIPSILIVAASGSRKALVFVVFGIVLCVLFRFSSKSILKTIIQWGIIGILLVFALKLIISLPIFSVVNKRMSGLISLITGIGNVDHSAWLREEYIRAGMRQFRKTPIFGLGISNSNYVTIQVENRVTYLHNNYVELLACGGVVGFLLYYSIYAYLLYKLIKYRKYNERYTSLCIILILLLLIKDYGAVSYYSKTTYFYIMFFFIELRVLKKQSLETNLHERYKDKKSFRN